MSRLKKFGEISESKKPINEDLAGVVDMINGQFNSYPPSFLLFLRQMCLIEDAPATAELAEMFSGYVSDHMNVDLNLDMDDDKVYELAESLRYGEVTLLHENTDNFPFQEIGKINNDMIMVPQSYDYRRNLSIAMIIVSRQPFDEHMVLTDQI